MHEKGKSFIYIHNFLATSHIIPKLRRFSELPVLTTFSEYPQNLLFPTMLFIISKVRIVIEKAGNEGDDKTNLQIFPGFLAG